ncbi:MAG: hypothetical protein R3A44_44195 [Caldilineaceae bacterium]
MSNERFSVSVNITENGGGSDNDSSSSGPVRPGCLLAGLAILLAVFGGIGNSVFSGNAFVYAPTTVTSSNMGAGAVFIIFLLIVLLALIILAGIIKIIKASQ